MLITKDWITGFVDGDGCFNIERRVTEKGISIVRHRFIVSQDKRSKDVLYALKGAFGCGSVHKGGSNMFTFQIGDRKSIENKVIPFFKEHPHPISGCGCLESSETSRREAQKIKILC